MNSNHQLLHNSERIYLTEKCKSMYNNPSLVYVDLDTHIKTYTKLLA